MVSFCIAGGIVNVQQIDSNPIILGMVTKRVKKPSPRKIVNVREMPTDLWDEKLGDYVKKTGKKKYAVVAEALRQFLDKEGEKS
jgi:hypothetical protein